MKNLALITPKSVYFSHNDVLSAFFRNTFEKNADQMVISRYGYWSGGNLGLIIVAALTPPEIQIDYIDENYESINFDVHYSLVGISAMTQQATRAYEIADEFRRRGVKVVIGGIHATVLPEEAIQHADAVVIGEAENAWPELISDFINGTFKPFYKSATAVSLKDSPLPRYELLKKYDYKMTWVQTTRGCPRSCEFCAASNVYGKAYRHKAIDQILNEIEYIRSLWKDPVLNFADDNMFANRVFSDELINRLQGMKLRWTAQTDVSVGEDDRLLDLLQVSGCRLLIIGFETLSIKGIIDTHGWKQSKIKHYPEIIKKIQSKGIGVLGAFIIGLDEDSATVVDDVSNFIIQNHLYASQVSVLTPLPGTRLRERLHEEKRILSDDWSGYTFGDVHFVPKQMTAEELQAGLLEVYKRIYSKNVRAGVIQHFKYIYSKILESKTIV